MKVKKNGTEFEFILDGAVGEGSPLFEQDIRSATRIVIDAEKMTYINSIGVKNWIIWTGRIPRTCGFQLVNAPLVMINQASTVVGFMPAHGLVASFNAPYVCPECDAELMVKVELGKHYGYAEGGQPRLLKLPEVACPKCKTIMETDFLEAKVFTFLDRKTSV